jgi:hypothetical protein
MTGRISEAGSYTLPMLSGPVDEARILGEPELSAGVAGALVRFAAEISSSAGPRLPYITRES